MRTFTLTEDTKRESTADKVCELVRNAITTNRNVGTGQYAYPNYESISGLFMYDKPVCVRTDISALTTEFQCQSGRIEVGSAEHDVYLSDALRKNINRWFAEGKGTAIIHMRSYPPYSGRRRFKRQGRKESYPHREDDSTYFYHLGGYGSTGMWNAVTSARSNNEYVPESVHSALPHELREADIHALHKYQHDSLPDETVRTHNLVWWRNGQIIDEFRHLSDYCGYPHVGSELIPVHTMEITNNESEE